MKIEEARAMWRELVALIRTAPLHETRPLVDEMIVDLDGMFPLPAARPRRKR